MREQQCPDCGRKEAAGSYCTGCYRRMGPADWTPTALTDAQRRARTGAVGTRRAAKGEK